MGRETSCVQGFIKLGLVDSFRMFIQQELGRYLLSPDPSWGPEASVHRVDVFQQEKGHGNDRGSHEDWSSVFRPLYKDLLKMKKSGVTREILTEKGVVTG